MSDKIFLFQKGTAAQIETELKEVHRDSIPADHLTAATDDTRSAHPTENYSEEMVDKINDIVMEDSRIQLREIAEMVGISYTGYII